MNSSVMPHDLMKGQTGSYAYMQIWSKYEVSWWLNCEKHPKKHIYTKQQNQNWPEISWKKNIVLLWKCIVFYNNLMRAKKSWQNISCKSSNKPGENLVRGGMGGGNLRSFRIDAMAHRNKISKANNIVWDNDIPNIITVIL